MRIPFFNWHDTRGERLERWEVEQTTDGRYLLFMQGPDEAADHVRMVSSRLVEVGPVSRDAWYTHQFNLSGPTNAATTSFLDLLTQVLSVPTRPGVDLSVALDFYKVQNEDMEWVDSEMGRCIHWTKHAKYPNGSGSRAAWRKLVAAMADFIEQHRIYAKADFVIAPPGSAGDGNSFGEKLARTAARQAGIEYVPCVSSGPREPQKEGLHQDLTNAFTVTEELHGTVIVIDDVYRSGSTMEGAAAAARRAGAERVITLTAARTVRH